jgi:hypothetical protein
MSPALAKSFGRVSEEASLRKIGHHDEEASERDEHSEPDWGGPC